MKITTVLTDTSTGVVGMVDDVATKAVVTGIESLRDCKQEIIMGAIGIGLMVAADKFLGDSEFMAQALEGTFEVTDVVEAAKTAGIAITGMAALTAAQKINKKYDDLKVIDDMDDEAFAGFLKNGCKIEKLAAAKPKRGSKNPPVGAETIE